MLCAVGCAAQDLARLMRLGAGATGAAVAAWLAEAQARARAMPPLDYYAVLGLSAQASQGEVRSAYRRLALRWHPDKAAGGAAGVAPASAEAVFRLVSDAHKVLGDAVARRQHDTQAAAAQLRHKYRRFFST